METEIILIFCWTSFILSMVEFAAVGAIDFSGHYKKIAPRCFNFMFWRNKYAPEVIPLVAAVLKLIVIIYFVISVVLDIIISVLLGLLAAAICSGALLGIHLIFSIAIGIVRIKFDKDNSLSRL